MLIENIDGQNVDFEDKISLNSTSDDLTHSDHFITERVHPPIYKKFVDDKPEYNLEDCEEIDGVLWKTPIYYFNHLDKMDVDFIILKNYKISENMDLFSIKKDKILVPKEETKFNLLKNGNVTYRFYIGGKLKRIKLRDLLAFTFLKVNNNPVTSVHLGWNKTGHYKYKGQRNHYTNLKILYRSDFRDYRRFKLSSRGDLYTVSNGVYRMINRLKKSNGLPYVEIRHKRKENVDLHELTAKLFLDEQKRGKYLFHRDGDLSNTDYRNLIYTNTLTGIKSDGLMYYSIPHYSDYSVSENYKIYSYKSGVLSKLTPRKTLDGYSRIDLIKNKGERFSPLVHRLIASLKHDFDPDLLVDHIDNDRQNNHPSNLRCVTPRQNNMNCIDSYIRGKPVIQLDHNYNVVKIFESCKKAAKYFKTDERNISKVALKNSNLHIENCLYQSCKQYWKYVENEKTHVPKKDEKFIVLGGTFQGVALDLHNYKISNYGTIINIKRNKIMKCSNTSGYWSVNLYNRKERKRFLVHILVALVFVPGRSQIKNQVNHIDENKDNLHSKNLEWVSQSENIKHSIYRQQKHTKQINPKTNNIINIYKSRVEAAESVNRSTSSIYSAINGMTKTSAGFKWEDSTEKEYLSFKH